MLLRRRELHQAMVVPTTKMAISAAAAMSQWSVSRTQNGSHERERPGIVMLVLTSAVWAPMARPQRLGKMLPRPRMSWLSRSNSPPEKTSAPMMTMTSIGMTCSFVFAKLDNARPIATAASPVRKARTNVSSVVLASATGAVGAPLPAMTSRTRMAHCTATSSPYVTTLLPM